MESLHCFERRESNSICVQRDRCHDQTGKDTVICIWVCVFWRSLLITCMQVHVWINMLDFSVASWVIFGYVWSSGSLVKLWLNFLLPLAHIFRFSFCEKELISVTCLVLIWVWEVNPEQMELSHQLAVWSVLQFCIWYNQHSLCSSSYQTRKLIMRVRAPPLSQGSSPKNVSLLYSCLEHCHSHFPQLIVKINSPHPINSHSLN